MAHNSYNPNREQWRSRPEAGDVRRPGPGPVATGLRLFALALVVRVAMVASGITLVHIPYLDHSVARCLRTLERTLERTFR